MTPLPPGWKVARIGDLGDYVNGRGFAKAEWRTSGLPIIRIQNLNDESAAFNYSPADHEEKYKVVDGDLLVAWAASLGVYIWKRGPAWLNQHIFRVEPNFDLVTKPFLYYALLSSIEGLIRKAHGSGMVHITKSKFEDHPISLPPRDHQPRIVSKIDELFSRIDEGERALEGVQVLVERYRQSILKAAVTGELTRHWREKNRDKLESGEELLARILQARREAWEAAELEKMVAKGKPPANDKWKSKYKEPDPISTDFLHHLPQFWTRVRVDTAGEVQLGRQRSPAHHNGEHMRPYLRVANVFENRIDTEDIMTMNFTPEAFRSYELHPGDVLLNEGQSKELVGRPAIYRGEVPGCCFTNTLVRFRPTGLVLPEFSLLVFLHYMKAGFFQKIAKITTNIAHLGAGRFSEMSFPVPSLSEQEVIVDTVAELSGVGRSAEASLAVASCQANVLRQSVLRAAFSGNLT